MKTALLLALSVVSALAAPPSADLNLKLAAPIRTWDEAVPLGNGTMGVLMWGEGDTLRLSLDRGDLWDERPSKKRIEVEKRFNWAAMQRMVAENKMGEFGEVFDSNYDYNGPPTKLPAGRVEVKLADGGKLEAFELNLASAEGIARLSGGGEIRAMVDAGDIRKPVSLVRIPGMIGEVRLLSPESVKLLGYAPPEKHEAEGLKCFEQKAADGFSYAVCAAWKQAGDETLLALTVSTNREGGSAREVAERRVKAALEKGYADYLTKHLQWWTAFWNRSDVSFPEPHILRQYELVRYFHGAASRRGAPPMPLQGVWSADAGSLPPWKGDYHNDLNTQMTYMAYQTAGHFEEGAAFLDLLWKLRPEFQKFARDFYQAPGIAVPGVMSLDGQALGGWGHYSLSPSMGAWNAHLFYLHWRYTGDDQFLRERAYPWCSEIGECLRSLLKPDEAGALVLPLSSSPEIFDNSRRAFLKPNSNYDIASLRMLFLSLTEMADALGKPGESAQWKALSDKLGPWHVRADGTLKLSANEDLPGSHRHLSNLMGIHPFNLITGEGNEADRRMIDMSLTEWDRMGTSGWCGYSFSWMASLRARVGRAEEALRMLDIYTSAFILRNGFHANGDQTKSGYSGFTYRPFTLEGNFLAMHAVNEMLLQSWSPTPGKRDTEIIRIFPATPWRWHDASFTDFHAEGGHVVSAKRENNATTSFRITAGRNGVLRLADNFGGRAITWKKGTMEKSGALYQANVRKGYVIEGTLEKPAAAPEAPENAAEPVVIAPPGAIHPNKLPLRIGADSQGNNRFFGTMSGVAVFSRVLDDGEIAKLAASREIAPRDTAGCVVVLGSEDGVVKNQVATTLQPTAHGMVTANPDGSFTFGEGGFLEIAHNPKLDCLKGVTLSAWIKPTSFPAGGMRLIDKTPVGSASAWMLDTYPGDSLRLIYRDPHLSFPAKLPANAWSHVAATVTADGVSVLYLNGKRVAGM